jgi:hypothetical protein
MSSAAGPEAATGSTPPVPLRHNRRFRPENDIPQLHRWTGLNVQAAFALAGVGVRSHRMGRKPTIGTPAGRGYQTLRISMQALFRHADIQAPPAAAPATFCRSEK